MNISYQRVGQYCLSKNSIFFAALVAILGAALFAVPESAFADGAPTNSSTISTTSNAAEYLAKAKQAEKDLNFNEAITWYQKAADLGDTESMYQLGWIYFGAHDIPGRQLKDYSKAAVWFQKAADLNYTPAITQLGAMYGGDGSSGVPPDHAKAAQLFLKAAQAGDAGAMNGLGVMYAHGDGVPKDIDKAVHWWKKAVEIDKNGPAGKAAQSWLDVHNGKPFCLYCTSSTK